MVRRRARPHRDRTQYTNPRVNYESICVYRAVEPDDSSSRRVPIVQAHVESRLREHGVELTERIAIDSLRTMLLPPQNLEKLRHRGVTSIPSAQRDIAKRLPNGHTALEGVVSASRGVILRSAELSLAVLLFNDPRLMEEQAAAHEAVGLEYDPKKRLPSMTIGTFPYADADPSLTERLETDLTQVAPLISVALGPVLYDARGHR